MPPRSIGKATIAFGLVSVPVSLYSSSEPREEISFHYLAKKTGSRVKQQYVDAGTQEVVERKEMVKGYEFAKDQYVIFSAEELKALDEKATGMIEILEFVMLSEVDREYLDKVYYLGPDKGGDRAYKLLATALEETGRAGLGQYAARGQQHLVLLRPRDGVLVMEQLHYADELRAPTEIPVGDSEVKKTELALAKQLIEQAASDGFSPERYHDTVRDRVLEAINRKVEGHEITAEPAHEAGGKIIDLMEALKASLAKSGDKGAKDGESDEKPAARRSPRARKRKSA
ncbi:MAG: Ku protein [Cytophagaceae bacterium]|nr:Ku protein [Gemmatimonadaceae bacterium]